MESIICGDTEITAADLGGAIYMMEKQNGFQHQLKVNTIVIIQTPLLFLNPQLLEQVSPNLNEVQCSIALAHPKRNRNNSYLPCMYV